MTEKRLTCAEVDELFADYFEGDLNVATRALVDAHAAECARCHALIRDIGDIRDAGALLSDLAPSRDLWQGIEARIQPAVVSIGARRDHFGVSRQMLGLAAAALIVISSSITYVVTKKVNPPARRVPTRVAEVPRAVPGVVVAAAPDVPQPTSSAPISTAPEPTRNPVATSPRTTLASATSVKPTASELELAPEINRLQVILRQKRNQLDPSTVRIVEDNLKLIDAAVKQSRAALAKDPASGFLAERLDNVLQKKVELLRTAALLPSSRT